MTTSDMKLKPKLWSTVSSTVAFCSTILVSAAFFAAAFPDLVWLRMTGFVVMVAIASFHLYEALKYLRQNSNDTDR